MTKRQIDGLTQCTNHAGLTANRSIQANFWPRLTASATLVLLLLSLVVGGVRYAAAQASLSWSQNPGAFEKHLIRRFNNPLFPKERRIVTQSDIDKARERDLRDYKRIEQDWLHLMNDFHHLRGNVISSSTVNEIRERIEELTDRAIGVGGQAYIIASQAKALRRSLIQDWKGWMTDADMRRRLEEAEKFYHTGVISFENPFGAELSREDSPIPNDEVISSLLTDIEQVRVEEK